jgi:hypothetical protein
MFTLSCVPAALRGGGVFHMGGGHMELGILILCLLFGSLLMGLIAGYVLE